MNEWREESSDQWGSHNYKARKHAEISSAISWPTNIQEIDPEKLKKVALKLIENNTITDHLTLQIEHYTAENISLYMETKESWETKSIPFTTIAPYIKKFFTLPEHTKQQYTEYIAQYAMSKYSKPSDAILTPLLHIYTQRFKETMITIAQHQFEKDKQQINTREKESIATLQEFYNFEWVSKSKIHSLSSNKNVAEIRKKFIEAMGEDLPHHIATQYTCSNKDLSDINKVLYDVGEFFMSKLLLSSLEVLNRYDERFYNSLNLAYHNLVSETKTIPEDKRTTTKVSQSLKNPSEVFNTNSRKTIVSPDIRDFIQESWLTDKKIIDYITRVASNGKWIHRDVLQNQHQIPPETITTLQTLAEKYKIIEYIGSDFHSETNKETTTSDAGNVDTNTGEDDTGKSPNSSTTTTWDTTEQYSWRDVSMQSTLEFFIKQGYVFKNDATQKKFIKDRQSLDRETERWIFNRTDIAKLINNSKKRDKISKVYIFKARKWPRIYRQKNTIIGSTGDHDTHDSNLPQLVSS